MFLSPVAQLAHSSLGGAPRLKQLSSGDVPPLRLEVIDVPGLIGQAQDRGRDRPRQDPLSSRPALAPPDIVPPHPSIFIAALCVDRRRLLSSNLTRPRPTAPLGELNNLQTAYHGFLYPLFVEAMRSLPWTWPDWLAALVSDPPVSRGLAPIPFQCSRSFTWKSKWIADVADVDVTFEAGHRDGHRRQSPTKKSSRMPIRTSRHLTKSFDWLMMLRTTCHRGSILGLATTWPGTNTTPCFSSSWFQIQGSQTSRNTTRLSQTYPTNALNTETARRTSSTWSMPRCIIKKELSPQSTYAFPCQTQPNTSQF